MYKVLFLLLAISSSYSQLTVPKFNISNSAGYGFDQKELTYYVSVTRSISNKISGGLKGGVYSYQEKVLDVVQNRLNAEFSTLPAGQYDVYMNNISVSGITYIATSKFDYLLMNKIQVSAAVGVKIYRQNNYTWNVRFMKSSVNDLPVLNSRTLNGLKFKDAKDIIRAYVSLGVDYRFGSFNIGVFGDNIYSAGITAGVNF